MQTDIDVIVVGGGLGGLATAALAARGGRRVRLYERAPAVGGRATTQEDAGYLLNQGPHALYCGGAAMPVLRELGVQPTGGRPPAAGHALAGGVLRTLPAGFMSLLVTGLLPMGAKLELARLLARVGKLDPSALVGVTVNEWLAETRHPEARAMLAALFRLSTYANAPDAQSAGAALAQLQMAVASGVIYLDGGWQTLVDGLRAAAESAGVELVTGARVTSVLAEGGCVRGVRLWGGAVVRAGAVVLAGSPAMAEALLTEVGTRVRAAAAAVRALPVRAACLDVGLRALPRPRVRFVLGIDQPAYLSVHSHSARLAPEGGTLIQVAKYLAPGTTGADAEPELEGLLDLAQPGWRDHVVVRRFMPALNVAGGVDTAAVGGLAGRPRVVCDDVAGLYLVGDWVGDQGMLADASLASARVCAAALVGAGAEAGAAARVAS